MYLYNKKTKICYILEQSLKLLIQKTNNIEKKNKKTDNSDL